MGEADAFDFPPHRTSGKFAEAILEDCSGESSLGYYV